jgi:hypothetical protein
MKRREWNLALYGLTYYVDPSYSPRGQSSEFDILHAATLYIFWINMLFDRRQLFYLSSIWRKGLNMLSFPNYVLVLYLRSHSWAMYVLSLVFFFLFWGDVMSMWLNFDLSIYFIKRKRLVSVYSLLCCSSHTFYLFFIFTSTNTRAYLCMF